LHGSSKCECITCGTALCVSMWQTHVRIPTALQYDNVGSLIQSPCFSCNLLPTTSHPSMTVTFPSRAPSHPSMYTGHHSCLARPLCTPPTTPPTTPAPALQLQSLQLLQQRCSSRPGCSVLRPAAAHNGRQERRARQALLRPRACQNRVLDLRHTAAAEGHLQVATAGCVRATSCPGQHGWLLQQPLDATQVHSACATCWRSRQQPAGTLLEEQAAAGARGPQSCREDGDQQQMCGKFTAGARCGASSVQAQRTWCVSSSLIITPAAYTSTLAQ
jgi:hypothetical protein